MNRTALAEAVVFASASPKTKRSVQHCAMACHLFGCGVTGATDMVLLANVSPRNPPVAQQGLCGAPLRSYCLCGLSGAHRKLCAMLYASAKQAPAALASGPNHSQRA